MPDEQSALLAESRARVYWFFGRLLAEAPGAEEMPDVLRVLGELGAAVGQPVDVGSSKAAQVAQEFQDLFVIPLPGVAVSLYGHDHRETDQGLWGEREGELAEIAAELQLEWRSPDIDERQAYIVSPDHLAVQFALLAEMITLAEEAEDRAYAGRSASEWSHLILDDLRSWVPRVVQQIAQEPYPFYGTVIRLVAEYLGADGIAESTLS